MPGAKVTATVYGLVTGVGASLIAAFASACPGLLENWPQILLAAVTAGVGKWLHSGRSADALAQAQKLQG